MVEHLHGSFLFKVDSNQNAFGKQAIKIWIGDPALAVE
jgi:hypothetical protein